MGPNQPQGQPPPGGAPWPGPPPPPPGPSSSLLTFVGVLNLIFAIACGCTSMGWAGFWSQAQDDPATIKAQLEPMEREIRVSIREQIEKGSERGQQDERVQKMVEEAFTAETMANAVVAAGEHPAAGAIRTATMVGAVAQAALLVGSILLLMRKNVGRILSMLALVAFIAATIATIVKFPPVAEAVGASVRSSVEETAGYRDLPPAEQRNFGEGLEQLPQVFVVAIAAISIAMIVWPAISLLILLFSRGIKAACAPVYLRP
jgi:hypothetical protein